jgi:putative DNA primase/helicase
MERKHDVNTNAAIKPDRTQTEVLCHALRSAASFETTNAPAWVQARKGDAPAAELIAFPNGLLHVPTRRFQPATRRFFNLNTVSFDYAPNAPDPRGWFSFLSDLWGNDREAIWTLQELFGLALTTDTSFQKLFMLIGPKRSGKGTIVRVLQGMVGDDNHCSPTLNGLGQHFGLESLIGKQLAVISDARLSGRADLGAIVENLLRISGEDTISVPRKHREDWTAKLGARFMVVSNEVPGFIDQSGALASRFVVLQLQQSFFGREDRALTTKLLTELPGILNWAIRGLDRLRERGHFMQPSSALEALRQLEALASPIKAFVAERCMLGGSTNADQLFQAWRSWSQDQGREHPGTAAMFSRNLSAAFPEIRIMRAQADGSPAHAFNGVCLKESLF